MFNIINLLPTEVLIELLISTVRKSENQGETVVSLTLINRRLRDVLESDQFVIKCLLRTTDPRRPALEALLKYPQLALRLDVVDALYTASLPQLGCYTIDKTLHKLAKASYYRKCSAYSRPYSHLLSRVVDDFSTYTIPCDYRRTVLALTKKIQEDKDKMDDKYMSAKELQARDGTPYHELQWNELAGYLYKGFWTVFGPTMNAEEVVEALSVGVGDITGMKLSSTLWGSLRPC